MLAEQRAHEPSMEEILASIRRIIADDKALPLTPRPAPEPVVYAAPAPVVPEPPANEAGSPEQSFEAPADREPVEVELRAVEPVAPEPEPAIDASQHEAAPVEAAEPEQHVVEPSFEPALAAAEPLLSERAGASVVAAFDQLAETVQQSHARIVEDAVRDMLRPMLKTWLDDNLPVVVERLVRAEIERVARGGR